MAPEINQMFWNKIQNFYIAWLLMVVCMCYVLSSLVFCPIFITLAKVKIIAVILEKVEIITLTVEKYKIIVIILRQLR